MEIPTEYIGREQTLLKHRILRDYLVAWAHKIGSIARHQRVRLWFVDCFAGPWNAQHPDLDDTSIAIGLHALEVAAETWRDKEASIDAGALFVEPDDGAYAALKDYLAARHGRVQTHAFHGEFGDHVAAIKDRIGSDAAFIFVDPTGWKGAAMRFIEPLMGRRRDVIVNVMFNHVNRFKDDPRAFLRDQMVEFFGLTDAELPAGLDEGRLLAFYRAQLKQRCRLPLAADLAVPHPTQDRTWFRLVVGGGDPAVLELFRDIERRVVGVEAGEVRQAAARRQRERRTSQSELALAGSNPDQRYQRMHDQGLASIEREVEVLLQRAGPQRFEVIWPVLLEEHHVTLSDVARRTCELVREGKLAAVGLGPRERTIKDHHVLSLLGPSGGGVNTLPK